MRYKKVHEIQGVISMTGNNPLNLKKDIIFHPKSAMFVVSLTKLKLKYEDNYSRTNVKRQFGESRL